MAGRWVPAGVDVGRTYPAAVAGNSRNYAPAPFNTDGSPNAQFEVFFAAETERYAALCRELGIVELHCPWYGKDWAELAHAKDVRDLTGYTYARWLTAHQRLIDIAAPFAGPDLIVEFPMSGSGPLPQAIDDLSGYIAMRPESDYLFVQGNGTDNDGVWGAPDQPTENQKDAALDPAARFGCQMIQPYTTYTPRLVFDQVRRMHGDYLEVYLPTFEGGPVAEWQTEIAAFS
jgi:hypothetical protein